MIDLKKLLAYADLTEQYIADSQRMLYGHRPSGTTDAARMALHYAKENNNEVRRSLNAAAYGSNWCPCCGDQKPGQIATKDGELKPCTECAK